MQVAHQMGHSKVEAVWAGVGGGFGVGVRGAAGGCDGAGAGGWLLVGIGEGARALRRCQAR